MLNEYKLLIASGFMSMNILLGRLCLDQNQGYYSMMNYWIVCTEIWTLSRTNDLMVIASFSCINVLSVLFSSSFIFGLMER